MNEINYFLQNINNFMEALALVVMLILSRHTYDLIKGTYDLFTKPFLELIQKGREAKIKPKYWKGFLALFELLIQISFIIYIENYPVPLCLCILLPYMEFSTLLSIKLFPLRKLSKEEALAEYDKNMDDVLHHVRVDIIRYIFIGFHVVLNGLQTLPWIYFLVSGIKGV